MPGPGVGGSRAGGRIRQPRSGSNDGRRTQTSGEGEGNGFVDITQLILDDHHEQRRRFAMLEQLDPSDTDRLSAVWGRLATLLEVHAQAEEELFYPELLAVGRGAGGVGTPEAETQDAIEDHNEIRDAVREVGNHSVGSQGWFEAVASANKANSDHMAEEEREGLTDIRRNATLERRHELAQAFAAYEARHFAGVPVVDKDPEGYIAEVERELGQPDRRAQTDDETSPGSVGIGSLKGR